MTDPGKILVAGDWHANSRWAEDVIWQSRALLRDEPMKIILQLGDFGVFSDEGGDHYLARVQGELEFTDAWLMVIPGNHEDYDRIESWREPSYPELATFMPMLHGRRLSRIIVLPRGHRWTWHGRTWLACGGAASPDRAYREILEGQNGMKYRWEQEYITDDDVRRCIDAGHADVLVSHDRPSLAPISLPPWPRGWADADRARCDVSREKIQTICQWTKPWMVIHGHYHQPFSEIIADLGYDDHPVRVAQLGRDGTDDNYRVLDVRDMIWFEPAQAPEPSR
jgi:hypothetical protein